ncbi:MAG TPA: hypothetical protein VGV60_09740 [Candidatus Polarisedimenticolia bacterium]|jgi:hypothetical protein|nr:hypothetical protein [Candidatus Polarisedimenticolia bacterium]
MGAGRIVSVFIEPNPNCPEGCSQRFQATSESRVVTSIQYSPGGDETILCDVAGWSSEKNGTPCPARAVRVEDSGAGVATLVYGGNWGLRLSPRDGRTPFGEPYLLLDVDAIVE